MIDAFWLLILWAAWLVAHHLRAPGYITMSILVAILFQCVAAIHKAIVGYDLRVMENDLVTEAEDEMEMAMMDPDDDQPIARRRDLPTSTRDMSADELLDYAKRRTEEHGRE